MTPPKRILMIVRSLHRNGGIEAHVLESAQAMHKVGYDVCIAIADLSHDHNNSAYKVVRVLHLDARKIPSSSRQELMSTITDFKPDIVHVHQLFDTDFVKMLRRYSPLAWSIHNYNAFCMGRGKYFASGVVCEKPHGPECMAHMLLRGCEHSKLRKPRPARYVLTSRLLEAVRQADITIAYSSFVSDQLRLNAVPRIERVPLFTQTPGTYCARNRKRRILFVGRIVPQKGLDVLLRALADIPDATLDVCGDGWGIARIQRLAQSLGVWSRVVFHGWCPASELESFYEDADVVVVPSIWPEPFGLVGIEAMRHARPVIASDTGGIRDWLTDRQTGLLVRPGDAVALGDALTWMLDHPDEADEMGRRGAEDVAARYSPPAFVAATERAYVVAQAAWMESSGEGGQG